jgi:CPA2 family monovalent cation:H+ antiporter-2
MTVDTLHINIVFILTIGFAYASVLGYLAVRCGLSSFLGYLLAGYLIGPFSPGFVADLQTSEQLAEIGVILMMFGVGLDFKWNDLVKVKKIAVVGALGQTLTAAAVMTAVVHALGWSWHIGLIIGLAVGVASTVVMIKVLGDCRIINTPQGHIAIGWLLVEDLIIISILILGPALFFSKDISNYTFFDFAQPLLFLFLKLILLAVIIFTLGRYLIAFALSKVVFTRSHELFTVSVLALTLVIATGSTILFGTSIALGSFLAGMVIGQTEVRHKALLHSIHLKDAFVVVFFLSVGMLFNPFVIADRFYVFIAMLSVILLIKPLVAFVITLAFKKPFEVALTLAFALAQIGELSFILAEEGMKFKILPDDAFDLIVACALITISINPLFFKFFHKALKIKQNAPCIDPDT